VPGVGTSQSRSTSTLTHRPRWLLERRLVRGGQTFYQFFLFCPLFGVVAVNLYPFAEAAQREAPPLAESILRSIASGDVSDLGDTSTLADPSVVESLVAGRV